MCLEGFRHVQRVIGIYLLALVLPLCEAHALSPDDINGRYQFYHNPMLLYKFKKLRKIRSPTPPLFSGWNCVA